MRLQKYHSELFVAWAPRPCIRRLSGKRTGEAPVPRSINSHALRMTICAIACLILGCQQTEKSLSHMREGTQQIFDYLSGNTAIVYFKKMEDRASADERRIGINWLVSRKFGQK